VSASLVDEELLEIGELEHRPRTLLNVVSVGRLEHHAVGELHHHVVGDPERGQHRGERPAGGLVALPGELGLGLGLQDEDVVVPGGQVAGALGPGRPGARDHHVVAVSVGHLSSDGTL